MSYFDWSVVIATDVQQQNFSEEMHEDSIATRSNMCCVLNTVAVFSVKKPAFSHWHCAHTVCAAQPNCVWQMATSANDHCIRVIFRM